VLGIQSRLAEAAVATAKVFPNPTLNLGGGRDATQSGSQRLPSTAGAAVTQTLELGGKRKSRVLGARQSYAAAAAALFVITDPSRLWIHLDSD